MLPKIGGTSIYNIMCALFAHVFAMFVHDLIARSPMGENIVFI